MAGRIDDLPPCVSNRITPTATADRIEAPRLEAWVRLNVIDHLLRQVRCKPVKTPMVEPPRRKIGRHKAADCPFKYVDGRY